MFFIKRKMDTRFYVSIVSGTLLTISEILPFVKSIKSNGLLDLSINVSKYMAKKIESLNTEPLNESSSLDQSVSLNKTSYSGLETEIQSLHSKLDVLLQKNQTNINIFESNSTKLNDKGVKQKRVILEM
jgi:hypothetical protein